MIDSNIINFFQFTESVSKHRSEYFKSFQSYETARTKYEEHCAKGKLKNRFAKKLVLLQNTTTICTILIFVFQFVVVNYSKKSSVPYGRRF